MGIEHLDLTGTKYGRLTPLNRGMDRVTASGRIYRTWDCICDCGTTKNVTAYDLVRGKVKSCGCLRKEQTAINGKTSATTHGFTSKDASSSHRRLHSIWGGMKQRCKNPNEQAYKHYGGRGITYCEDWEVFENFKNWAMSNGYRDDLTLDRIDCNGNYEPSNCRWADWVTQSNNRRTSVKIKVGNEEHTATEWSKMTGQKPFNIGYRYKAGGLDGKEIIGSEYLRDIRKKTISFNGETHSIKEWGKIKSLSYSTINWRIKNGWSVEDALNTPAKVHDQRTIEVNGVTHTVHEWAEINDVGITTIYERLQRGWSEQDAVTLKPHSGVDYGSAVS